MILINELLAVYLAATINKNEPDAQHLISPQPQVYQAPTPTPGYSTSLASYYDQSVCVGRVYGKNCKTANGEVFNKDDFTVAHKSFSFGTRVEFRLGNHSVVCRINDRGPFVGTREFDLSYGCANAIGLNKRGVAKVQWRLVN